MRLKHGRRSILMKIHTFAANYSGATHYTLKKNATNNSLGRLNHNLMSKEEYLTNQQHFKDQAYLRVQSLSIYNISLNADGSIDVIPKEDADKEINWVPLEMSMKSRVSNHTRSEERRVGKECRSRRKTAYEMAT